ncbi:MAG TPA: YqhA family protein, partial [Gallionella sp.]|nr:YqhA family protein [Gallionella sp.]
FLRVACIGAAIYALMRDVIDCREHGMGFFEKLFEGALWNSRFIILTAVVGSLLAGITIFYMATVDVLNLFSHALHYADASLTVEARKALHDSTVSHIVEVVDGYLLATVMLIFSLGLYELFISDIDQAHGSKSSSKILVINNLDDLKSRLAKVILMIMIVTLFENALNMHLSAPLDLVYLGASIALIALALYFTHASESSAGGHTTADAEAPEKHGH